MSLNLICNTCALMLGAPQEQCTQEPWVREEAIPCDNCSKPGMLKSLEAWGLELPKDVLNGLANMRLTMKAILKYTDTDGIKAFMIETLGPQVFDPWLAKLEDRIAFGEAIKRGMAEAGKVKDGQ